jgi:energy-coupling factor transporter ATP-binding protein EcfA2
MKTCVLNLSGNVGKSTIAKHVLGHVSPESKIILVESRNSTENGKNTVMINGESFDRIQEELLIEENVIIDVGASNIDEFVEGIELYSGSVDDIDRFIVPVTPEGKIREDTVETILLLINELNVPTEKIRIVFNRTTTKIDLEFSDFIAVCEELGIKLNLDAALPESDFFEKIRDTEQTIKTIVSDKTDYRKKIKDAKTREDKLIFAEQILLPRLALGIQKKVEIIGDYING